MGQEKPCFEQVIEASFLGLAVGEHRDLVLVQSWKRQTRTNGAEEGRKEV